MLYADTKWLQHPDVLNAAEDAFRQGVSIIDAHKDKTGDFPPVPIGEIVDKYFDARSLPKSGPAQRRPPTAETRQGLWLT